MNYQLIYDKFINLVSSTTPRERLNNRNPKDFRLKDDYIYTENHHILPKSLGGTDDPNNLVCLLPEEHLFIHYFRYKIFDTKQDLLAFRFCLNGYRGKHHITKINKFIKNGYMKLKQESSRFRKIHGWHTPEGRKNISEYRKNKIPAKDQDGNYLGYVPNDHPNIINGVWVHTSLGVKRDNNFKLKCSINTKGLNNPNSSGLSDQDIINNIKSICVIYGYVPPFQEILRYCKQNNIPMINLNNRLSGSSKLLKSISQELSMEYNPTKLSEDRKNKIRETLSQKELIISDNDIINIFVIIALKQNFKIPSFYYVRKYCKMNNIPMVTNISPKTSRFNNQGISGLYEAVEEKLKSYKEKNVNN